MENEDGIRVDIRVAAEMISPTIAVFNEMEMWDEARRAILLHQYILDTYKMESELEKRADYIQTECFAMAETARDLVKRLSEKAEEGEGPDIEDDGGTGTARG